MTKPQLAALKRLSEGPRMTSGISGSERRMMKSFEDRDWARWRPGLYEITTTGLLVLNAQGALETQECPKCQGEGCSACEGTYGIGQGRVPAQEWVRNRMRGAEQNAD